MTTDAVYGEYTGTMTTYTVTTQAEGEEEAPVGTEVEATVADDTICVNSFPIRDIVLSVVGDEALADQIVEAVGDVDYKIGYKPALAAEQDSISLALNPEPLKLSVVLPSDSEEEAAPLAIEVKVETDADGSYAVENGKLIFRIAATEVLIGEGEEQAALPNFTATTFDFDMDQSKVSHN